MKILDRIAEWQALAEKATSGPWKLKRGNRPYQASWWVECKDREDFSNLGSDGGIGTYMVEDAEFIASARTAVPELCRALRIAVEALEEMPCGCFSTNDFFTNKPKNFRCYRCEALARIKSAETDEGRNEKINAEAKE